MITTEAWVLYRGTGDASEPAELKREEFTFPDISAEEILVEPCYVCWEANMTHALRRRPVDVCRLRCEPKVVLGNAGVVRVVEKGAAVTSVAEGDICVVIPVGKADSHGYTLRVYAYDAPNTVGLLAKRTKLHESQAVRIPKHTRHSWLQWAASSVRYATAWDNWKVAYGCWRVQMSPEDCPEPIVWGWGGGVSLAELSLARRHGCQVAMVASTERRLQLIEAMGITPIDRRQFRDLNYDEEMFRGDPGFRKRYSESERTFLRIVREQTNNRRVSIFIDNIGTPVIRATLKALARQGVITTAGWDKGATIKFSRIDECIGRHLHVHTYGARYKEGLAALQFADESNWLPPIDGPSYRWEQVPELAAASIAGEVDTYFPVLEVSAVQSK